MIVKMFSSAASFDGVKYNINKIDKAKGELMHVSGFGPLQALSDLRPEDYKNYLKMISARNKAVSEPQFHAAISTKGKSHDKHQLTEIAIQWLAAMGYEKQPYLIVFHKDTGNNHVHIVSSRIDKNGRKISSGFEWIRGQKNMNKVMGIDEKYNAANDLEKALSYNFSTIAQFRMILENRGYVLKEIDGQLQIIKFGAKQADVSLEEIKKRIKDYTPNKERIARLTAIFNKYAAIYDTSLKLLTIPIPGGGEHKPLGYTSDFAGFMKSKMGIQLLFHSKDGKTPYGYSIIDHAERNVLKGSEILALKELLNYGAGENPGQENEPALKEPGKEITQHDKIYYASLLKAVLHNYPDLRQGLQHQGFNIIQIGGEPYLQDDNAKIAVRTSELLKETDNQYLYQQFGQYQELNGEIQQQYQTFPQIFIASDVDDEAINGRNRRRKRRARTNTR